VHSVILTELGIAVFEDKKCLEVFPFSNPSEDFVFVKKGESRLSDLVKYLSRIKIEVTVSDQSLLSILKKKSIDSQLMDAKEISYVQSFKPKILVEAGFAKDESDAMTKLRDFAINLSSSKVSEIFFPHQRFRKFQKAQICILFRQLTHLMRQIRSSME